MEWQPIETAPKDGTRFLGKNNSHGMHECKFSYPHFIYGPMKGWDENGTKAYPKKVNIFQPTHWMPLPEAPE